MDDVGGSSEVAVGQCRHSTWRSHGALANGADGDTELSRHDDKQVE